MAASVVVVVGRGISDVESVANSEDRCGSDAETNDDSDDDGNCCGSVGFESADYCCSPKSLVATDSAFAADDDAFSMDYQI